MADTTHISDAGRRRQLAPDSLTPFPIAAKDGLLHRAGGEIRLVVELMRVVNEAPDVHAALGAALQRICLASGWALGQAWIPGSDGHLVCDAWYGQQPGAAEFHEASRQTRFASGDSLPGSVWATQASQWIGDLSAADPEFRRADVAVRLGMTAAVGIPVLAGSHVVAVIEFLIVSPQPDDERLARSVSAVAAQLGAFFQHKQAEEQLERLFTLSPTPICLASFDGFLRRVNPACEKMCGYTAAELMSRPYLELVHPDERPAVIGQLMQLQGGAESATYEFRCLRRDGTSIWTVWSATTVPNQQVIVATGRDISERKRVEEAVRQSEEHYRELFHEAYRLQMNLRRLSDRVLLVQEQERTRLSRELHDEVGQSLTAASLHLSVLRRELGERHPTLAHNADAALDLLQETMESVHRFARELRPAMLDDLGLLPALRSYVKAFTSRTGIPTEFNVSCGSNIESLDPEGKTVLYRVLQEGLNNIAKHAQATKVDISLAETPAGANLEIRDNGRGFDASRKAEGKSTERLGLLGIQERVRLVNGSALVESRPGEGVWLHITIPFKPV